MYKNHKQWEYDTWNLNNNLSSKYLTNNKNANKSSTTNKKEAK